MWLLIKSGYHISGDACEYENMSSPSFGSHLNPIPKRVDYAHHILITGTDFCQARPIINSKAFKNYYYKVASSNTSRLEAHADFFSFL